MPRRLAFGIVAALVMAAGSAAVCSFVWPDEDSWVNVGRIDDFPRGTVTALGTSHQPLAFQMVRLRDGELLALIARLPHPNLECVASYRPDFEFSGRRGWFFEPCRNEVYDMAGQQAFGRWPRGLPRLAVEVRDGIVYVDLEAVTEGARGVPEGYEFRTGAALLPGRRYEDPTGRVIWPWAR